MIRAAWRSSMTACYLYCPDKHLRSLWTTSGSVLWSNDDSETLKLIEKPGKGLISTPGWRTQTLVVATPKALVIQGQTLMNVVGISTENGKLLWQKKKITSNPNAIYVDGQVIVGVGPNGRNVALDPGERRTGRGSRLHQARLHAADGQHRFPFLPRRGHDPVRSRDPKSDHRRLRAARVQRRRDSRQRADLPRAVVLRLQPVDSSARSRAVPRAISDSITWPPTRSGSRRRRVRRP